MSNSVDLKGLLPNLSFDGGIDVNLLSAIFVLTLIVLFFVFITLTLIHFFKSLRQVKFYSGLLHGLGAAQLFERRRDITERALRSEAYGNLWREFDESLVAIPEKKKLCNSLDSSHFFNTYTLASKLTENRLLAAVPGFMTAVGVLGTFIGLQLGLTDLSGMDPNTTDIDQMKFGIFGMISGASMAFMTSVWGVGVSVVFNFVEKSLERTIRTKISELQKTIDYLYPRITPEESLVKIEHNSFEATNALKVLDEKIGEKLQIALEESSNVIGKRIEDALNNVMAPAIQALVEGANDGSERALRKMLTEFSEGMGEAGREQRELMNQAADKVGEAVQGISTELNSFIDNFNKTLDDFDERAEQQTEKQNETLIKLANFQVRKLQEIEGGVVGILNSIEESIAKQQQSSKVAEEERSTHLSNTLTSISNKTSSLMDVMENRLNQRIEQQNVADIERSRTIAMSIEHTNELQTAFKNDLEGFVEKQRQFIDGLDTKLQALTKGFEHIGERNSEVSEHLKQAANNLGQVGTEISSSSKSLQSVSNNYLLYSSRFKDSLEGLSERFAGLLERTESLQSSVNNISNGLIDTVDSFKEASELASSGLKDVNQHFTVVSDSLKKHTEELQLKMAELLNSYANQVQGQTTDRLNSWNKQTNDFITQMTQAVESISSVVDDIETKVRAS